jgi:LysR family glycine cleavage system transcriptional activator
VDAAILLGSDAAPGVVTHRLIEDARVPVCAPEFMALGLRTPRDLARQTLLQQTTRPRSWVEWLAAAGINDINGLRGPQFQHMAMVAAAAAAGLGVALLPRFLVAADIEAGSLAIPFDQPLQGGEAYLLAYPEAADDAPALRAFRDWLLAEAAQ